jgi:hypothetical protein
LARHEEPFALLGRGVHAQDVIFVLVLLVFALGRYP